MYEYEVVCSYTGEILYTSPFLYMCDKFRHDNSLIGCTFVYDTQPLIPGTIEYFDGYFELQMIDIMLQCMSK